MIFYILPLRAVKSHWCVTWSRSHCNYKDQACYVRRVTPIRKTRNEEKIQKPAAIGLGLLSLQQWSKGGQRDTVLDRREESSTGKTREETQGNQLPSNSSVLVSFIHSHCMAKMREKKSLYLTNIASVELYESVEH